MAYLEPENGRLGFYKVDLAKSTIVRIEIYLTDIQRSMVKRFLSILTQISRFQHLFIFDLVSEELRLLGSFKQPMRFNYETRCDLHPRVSVLGDLYFDSCHSGRRKLYKLNWN